MASSLIEVEGFSELAKALAATGLDMRRTLRKGLVSLAEPIAKDAEQFAVQRIPRVTLPWSRMRVGIAPGFSLVYVAPNERGVRTRGQDARRRPNFADLLRDRALAPSVQKNAPRLVSEAEELVNGVIERRWAV